LIQIKPDWTDEPPLGAVIAMTQNSLRMNRDVPSNHAADQRIGREETATVAALLALAGGYP
jgi:hypothetical protein